MLEPAGQEVQLAPLVGIVDPATHTVQSLGLVAPLGQIGVLQSVCTVDPAGEINIPPHGTEVVDPPTQYVLAGHCTIADVPPGQ